jgi:hypothetical protein
MRNFYLRVIEFGNGIGQRRLNVALADAKSHEVSQNCHRTSQDVASDLEYGKWTRAPTAISVATGGTEAHWRNADRGLLPTSEIRKWRLKKSQTLSCAAIG